MLDGHCVVKIVSKNNPEVINLLSFGGFKYQKRHTLTMKYVSVWNEKKENKETDIWKRKNEAVYIGRDQDYHYGVRAVLGGSNNHLLFITYHPNNIDVYDLDKLYYINHSLLPIDTKYSIIVLRHEMILFCEKTGLSIDYDEKTNRFQFYTLYISTTMKEFKNYAYICTDDAILFFGGSNGDYDSASKNIHKFSLIEKEWIKFEQTLPFPLSDAVAIRAEDNSYIHILGMDSGTGKAITHVRTNKEEWRKIKTEQEKEWSIKEIKIHDVERDKKEMQRMKREREKITSIVDLHISERQNEILTTIEYWIRSLFIKMGWINDFNKIILQYTQMKYFLPSKYFLGHSKCINSVKFSRDGTKIVSASDDGTIRVWDIKWRNVIQVLKDNSAFIHAQFSPDDKMIVSISRELQIQFWDIKYGEEIRKIELPSNGTEKVQISLSENIIASSATNNSIIIWDLTSVKEIKILVGHLEAIQDIRLSPDNQMIVSYSLDNAIILWDVKSGKRIHELAQCPARVCAIQFSPDGRSIVSCYSDMKIRIWDVVSGTKLKEFEGYSGYVSNVQYFPNGQMILVVALNSGLLDVKLGEQIQKLEGKYDIKNEVDISSDLLFLFQFNIQIRLLFVYFFADAIDLICFFQCKKNIFDLKLFISAFKKKEILRYQSDKRTICL
ncbi:G-protein beta WD-40 repeats containing protein [Reticulomyxa filosa]|uniref:G-protein beta WD-40 repeats containing protein n=1 Tax=Reticulomyxa filosa TaxID=46433 RepID=X6M3I3_RETFI|nr:G-protein beta WD-40 repeats containing protein [Reticulomyxa filosa]|eukprot:ETO08027.1 G-protein beta WD-40 repeats containing protein [Reticulomyxa filosa]